MPDGIRCTGGDLNPYASRRWNLKAHVFEESREFGSDLSAEVHQDSGTSADAGGTSPGLSFTLRKIAGVWFVRFRHGGHRYELSTGCGERAAAEGIAAIIHARVVAGDWQKAEPVCDDARAGLRLHRTGVVTNAAESMLAPVRDALAERAVPPAKLPYAPPRLVRLPPGMGRALSEAVAS